MPNTSKSLTNILVVDDLPENLTILTSILAERGHTVRPAINGAIAIKAAQHVPPDLILLDIMMPGMDGYEVCRLLKADARTRDIPVIFISALDETWNKVKAFEKGGVDYVTKPFEAHEVVARVETHLAMRRMQQQLQEQNIHLQQEIQERTRIEAALRTYTRELAIVNTLSSFLQTCQHEAEMYSIVARSCEQLFPGDSGYVALANETGTELRQAFAWGGYPITERVFAAQDYPLLVDEMPGMDEQHRAEVLGAQFEADRQDAITCFAIMIGMPDAVMGVFVILLPQIADQPQDKQREETTWMMANGVVEHYSLALANIRLRERLRLEAIRDPLTDLFNRRYMEEALDREVRRADRNRTAIGILMLDIDHFKRFNDTYGHEAGDVVLQHLGQFLKTTVRGGDIACRYGGEEFLLILPDISSHTLEQRIQNLLKQIRALPIEHQGQQFAITLSIGVAMFPEHGSEVSDVVAAADSALYQAKRNGRDQAVFAASPGTENNY